MNEQKIVQVCLRQIFQINGYYDPETMKQRDFEHISSEIEKKSGVVISGITIKRLSKASFAKSPQIATLNAIANYLDFRTWQEYKSGLNLNNPPDLPQKEQEYSSSTSVQSKKNYAYTNRCHSCLLCNCYCILSLPTAT
jgi:hypothetical protein